MDKSSSNCEMKWIDLVGQQLGCSYLQMFTTVKHRSGGTEATSFEFVPEPVSGPRILMLGDSVSRGIWKSTMELFAPLKTAFLRGAPMNCGGLGSYDKNLPSWLGTSPWA